jgi:nitronate monooxygenase
MWPNQRFTELLGIEIPIVQAPMAGASGTALTIAVSQAGGLGSLPCAMLKPEQALAQIETVRAAADGPLNLNFFCHAAPVVDSNREAAWLSRLSSYYAEFGLELPDASSGPARAPFAEEMCVVVETCRPEVVSFHFGLPERDLLKRVKDSGALVFSSATTVAEARWLEQHGCDVIIAQGYEAGGHRGIFLSDDINTQPGTMALVPQVVDAVSIPVIAAGGITDARGIVAAFALGAAGVQMGTAYLLTPEALISELHRAALASAADDQTALTNVFSGRPARGLMNRVMREVGPMSDQTPAFPGAGAALAPLKAAAEAKGEVDFTSLWSGQAATLAEAMPAAELTQRLAAEALHLLGNLNAAVEVP